MIQSFNINGAWDRLGNTTNIYDMSQEGPNIGEFKTSNGYKKEIHFVFLALDCRRFLFPKPYNPNNVETLCRADDCEHPNGGTHPQTGPCSGCQKSKWTKQNGMDNAPECLEIFNLYAWDVENQCPFTLSIKRTGIKALRDLKGMLQYNCMKYSNRGVQYNYCIIFRLSSTQEKYGAKTYFIPKFEILRESDEELRKNLQSSSEYLLGLLLPQDRQISLPAPEKTPDEATIENTPSDSNPPASVIAGLQPKKEEPVSNGLPNLNMKGWYTFAVPFKKLNGMTWEDLMHDKPLPDNSCPGRTYLQKLAHWTDRQDIADVAKAALDLAKEWDTQAYGEPPF